MSVSGYPSFHHSTAHRFPAPRSLHNHNWRHCLLLVLVADLIALIVALLLEVRILPAITFDGHDGARTSAEIKCSILCAAVFLPPDRILAVKWNRWRRTRV